jgi:hypothetical protein
MPSSEHTYCPAPAPPSQGVKEEHVEYGFIAKPLRTLAEISADILAIEREAEGLLDGMLVQGAGA